MGIGEDGDSGFRLWKTRVMGRCKKIKHISPFSSISAFVCVKMPVQVQHIPFTIREPVVLDFMDHCFYFWRDTFRCSDANVSFMKHLVRHIFHLPQPMQLVGIRFEDRTLVMLHPPDFNVFFVLEKTCHEEWIVKRVTVEGYIAQWGMETGFWDGLDMSEAVLMDKECSGPSEDEI